MAAITEATAPAPPVALHTIEAVLPHREALHQAATAGAAPRQAQAAAQVAATVAGDAVQAHQATAQAVIAQVAEAVAAAEEDNFQFLHVQ